MTDIRSVKMSTATSVSRRAYVLLSTGWTAGGVALFALAPQLAPGVLLLSCVIPLAQCNSIQTVWRVAISAPFALLYLTAIYLLVNSTWSLDTSSAIGVAFVVAAIATTVGITYAALDRLDRDVVQILTVGVIAGTAIGGAVLCFEVLSDLYLRRQLMHLFPAFDPKGGSLRAEGTRHLYVVNRSIAVLAMLLWPTLLLLLARARSRRRFKLALLLVLPTLGAVLLSEHASSQLAVATSAFVFAVCWIGPRIGRGLVMASFAAATLFAVPIATFLYAQNLQNSEYLFYTARQRVVIWGHASAQVANAPLLGIGVNSGRVLNERTKGDRVGEYLLTSTHTHSIYLQAWYETGALGALLLLAIGLLVIEAIAGTTVIAQPFLYATFTSCAVIGGFSFSLWQPWFMCAFGLSAVLAKLGVAMLGESDDRPPV